jgi:uncharacterized membrane protein
MTEPISTHGSEVLRGPSQRRRVLGVLPVGVVVGILIGLVAPWELAVLAAWAVTAGTFVVRVWARLSRFDEAETRAFATREDTSRPLTEFLLLCASSAALVAVAFGLAKANKSQGLLEALLIAASAATIVASWSVIVTVFTLRYASAYYTPPVGGIDFKDDSDAHDYHDFAYVAVTVSATFQVSDTDITSPHIRRIVLPQALLSFVFVVAIIASSINVLATLLNK